MLSPADWTRDLAAELVSVVCQWHGGDWCSIDPIHIKSRGKILAPSTRAGRIAALRIFFRDLQEWELIPRRFDPMRHLTPPKSLVALIGPNPRVIADDVWAIEAERAKRKEIEDARQATFDRILANAPATFAAAQLRLVLRALVSCDEYSFGELASEFADAEITDDPTDTLLLSVIDGTADDKLIGFALRLALTQHKVIPAEDQIDFLAEAELAFAPLQPAKAARSKKKAKAPTPIKPSTPKKKTNKKRITA